MSKDRRNAELLKQLSYLLFRIPIPFSEFIGHYATRFLLNLGRLHMKAVFRSDSENLSSWKRLMNVFFILGMGRSGTQFLSNLLNRAPKTCVVHEPLALDFAAYVRAYYSETEAYRFIHEYRQKEMYLRLNNMDIANYGEVNSLLRRHIESLRAIFPSATYIHLVRDGRDVVRSMMSRDLFQPQHPITRLIKPKEHDCWSKEWSEMNRFEKLCWFWQIESRYVRERTNKTVQFERLIADYEYFNDHLLQPLQLTLSKNLWLQIVDNPQNRTHNYSIPYWSDWNTDRQQSFTRICGNEMEASGYPIDWRKYYD